MGVGELRIKGTVGNGVDPIEGAYVTLNAGNELIAERRTGPDGIYEFHATPGDWTLIARAANCGAETFELKDGKAGEFVHDFTLIPVS